jgi:predicted ATP-dependent serine protease
MPWFMKMTGGWGKGWMCYIYGRAGRGKTSVLTTAVTQFGRDNIPFLYISLEENLDLVTQRVFSCLENINRTHFRDICLTQTEWASVYSAANSFSKFSGYWAYGIDTEKAIIDAVQRTMADIVIIDYLQLLDTPGKTERERLVYASKFLVRLSNGKFTNGRKITVIAAAQLNDDNQVLGSRDPDRDADLTVEIADIDSGNGVPLPDRKKFTIKKFRHGGVDSTQIAFLGARSLVGDLARGNNIGPIPRPTP